MNIWFAKGAVLAANIVMIAIRAPHGQRSRGVKVVKNARGALENVLIGFAGLAMLLTIAWLATPLLSFADYPLHPASFVAGLVITALGLWLFARSHSDLGTNWSITLEVREKHVLVSHGVYRHIRHPMYSSLFVFSLGQALFLPNWVAGPASLVSFAILFAFRVGREERLMLETFGAEYAALAARTKRLVPGVW